MYYQQAKASDYDLVLMLLQEAAHRLQLQGIDQWAYWLDPPPYKRSWLRSGVEAGQYHFLLSETDDIASMYRLSESDVDYWGEQQIAAYYVHSLVVRPAYSGRGYGRQMLEDVELSALAAGKVAVRLDCHAGNTRLCKYYLDLGYVKVGEKEMPHSLNNLYEKRLSV